MLVLIAVGLLAGLITSISPCVLPLLPVVLAAGSAGDRRSRPYGLVAGLVISFCASTLAGSLLLSALGLPQDLLRDLGIAVLAIVGLGMIWRPLGELIERPFSRLSGRPVNPDGNGVVVGLGAGLLFVPCAGPVLATIAVVGATHRIGPDAIVLIAAFGIGVGVPLLLLALAGDALTRRLGALRRRARVLRAAGGAVMIIVAVVLGLNLTDGLQQLVPGYTAALQSTVESNQAVTALADGPLPVVPAPAPTPTDVADTASPSFFQTPETYLGYRYGHATSGTVPVHDRTRTYRFPDVLAPDTFALSGSWRAGPEFLTAGSGGARMELDFRADTVYLVLGGTGTVTAEIDGVTATVPVSGPPTLYRLGRGSSDGRTTLTLTATARVRAYDFTFG